MAGELNTDLLFILIATGVGIAGGITAYFWVPGVNARSAVQHFAAGVVLAAVAMEVIPEVQKIGPLYGVLGGFAVGGAVMIGLKWAVLKFERIEASKHKLPVGLAVAAGVDTLIDGAIISAGFSSGQELGRLLAIVLAIELFFLTLSVGSEFHKSKSQRWRGVMATTGIALLLLLGAVGAYFFLRGASMGTVAVFLSFGAVALIYLIAEELLVESIEAEENLFSTTMLFAGFFVIFALIQLRKGGVLSG